MAASVSDVEMKEEHPSRLLELPTDCLVRIVSILGPLDVCRVARVCRTLRAVADSDTVWVPRLPSHPVIYSPILSNKDLHFRLRAGMLRKDFSQPYWLDPATGEGCLVKKAKDLKIVWGDDERHYWRWIPQNDSWFPESACLYNVCFLEVCGALESIFMPGNYTVSFRMRFVKALGGWARAPVKLRLSTSDGQSVESQRMFQGNQLLVSSTVARLRTSGTWMELDIGEFQVESEMRLKVEFSMMEIEGGMWKRGIVVDCAKIQCSSVLMDPLP